MSRISATHNKGNLRLIMLSSTLAEEVAVQGGWGVGYGVPVVIPGNVIKCIFEPLYSSLILVHFLVFGYLSARSMVSLVIRVWCHW